MPQDGSTAIQALYDAFAHGDVPFVMSRFSPELVWNEAENSTYADRNPYVGPQAVLEGVFARLATEWDGYTVTAEEIVGAGDTVIACGRYRGTFKASGVAVNAQFVHVWRLRDGLVVGFQQYTDTAQFRDAAGHHRSAIA
jgi:hypothetical protein